MKISWEAESDLSLFGNVINEFWSQYARESLLVDNRAGGFSNSPVIQYLFLIFYHGIKIIFNCINIFTQNCNHFHFLLIAICFYNILAKFSSC